MHTRRKTSFSISLPSSKLTISLILFINTTLTTSLILILCRTRLVHELRNGPLSVDSLCLSDRVSKRGIRRSEVGFLMGTRNIFLCPTLVIRPKNIFLDFFTQLKTCHLSYSIYKGLIIPLLFSILSILILVCELHPIALSVHRIHRVRCTLKTKTTKTKPFKCCLCSFLLKNSLL